MNLKKYRRIIRTYASSSFRELKEKKKGDKTLTRGKNKKIIINKTVYILSQTRVFSPWEENIIKRIENAGFTTERKFFKFPLKIDDKMYLYIPDLLIKDILINRKKVIVEAHRHITEEDIKKYRMFRSVHGREYHLIMIVTSSDLLEWNKYNKEEALFHDVWTSKDLSFMVSKLKQKKKENQIIDASFGTHICPSCGISATGREETQREFGFRRKKNGDLYTQSLCYDCRRHDRRKTRKKKTF